jgi:hypothetical protein
MSKPYWTCPDCGANLDCSEKCDCTKQEEIIDLLHDELDNEILYLCDRKKCNPCHKECKHTTNIAQCMGFEQRIDDSYWERSKEDLISDVTFLRTRLIEERGEDHILTCAIEEMSELTKVLTKRLRNSSKFTISKLEEELGHVYLLCDLIKDKFNISEEAIYDHKLDALTRAFL